MGVRKRLHAAQLAKMDKMRKEFWASYRPRQEIEAYREQITAGQKRAEKMNELRRIEGMLSKTTRHHRLGYQRPRDPYLNSVREQLMSSLGVTNSAPRL